MAVAQSKLGVYWGAQGLSFIETVRSSPTHRAFLPLQTSSNQEGGTASSLLRDASFLEQIQKVFRNNGFTSTDITFSAPSKDIILRWFVIPWMRPNEIQGVVTFEVRKHLPFPLEDLTYTYYPSTFTQGGIKQIGVVFVGMRKEIFRYYTAAFAQAGLNVVFCEPSVMSLLRALVFQKIVEPSQNVAILQVDENSGEIGIASNGFVRLIRDFNFSTGPTPAFKDSYEFLHAKLYNEVRMSLDFFSRQHSEDVAKIVVLTAPSNKGSVDSVITDIGIPFISIDPQMFLGADDSMDIGLVNAFGATLNGEVPTVIDFNISEGEGAIAVCKEDVVEPKFPPRLWPVISLVLSGIILGGTWLLSSQQLIKKNVDISILKGDLGEFIDVPVDDIDRKNSKIKKFVSSVKDLTLRSSFAPVAARLITLMPKGMWLDSLTIIKKADQGVLSNKKKDTGSSSAEGKSPSNKNLQLALQFSGFLFINDTNAEFDEVSRFVSALRSDDKLSSVFKDIKLLNIKAQELSGQQVTTFSVECQ